MRFKDGTSTGIAAVTRVGNAVLPVAASGLDDDKCDRAVTIARDGVAAPPGL